MTSPLENVELHLVNSLDEAMAFKRWLGERHKNDIVGLDTESGGLSPYRDRLRMVQFGDTVHGWAIPSETWLGLIQETLEQYDGDYVLHNSSYDWQVCNNRTGIKLPWHRMHDTMTLAHLADPERPKGLKPLGDRLIDPRASSGQYLLHDGMAKQGWTWDTVPVDFDPYWIYSALDPVLTALIYDKLKSYKDIYAGPYDIERAAIRYTAEMSQRAVPLDMEYIDRKIDELNAFIEKAKHWLYREYGVTSVNSSGQLAKALESDGISIIFFTGTGKPQMDSDALKFYSNVASNSNAVNLVSIIRNVRKAEKTISTYLMSFKEKSVNERLHCSIHPCAAVTSRMSISDPSMQNLPTDDELVRGAILAEPGHVLLSVDFNQLEMRLAADFSGDLNLIETFRKSDLPGGKSFFLQSAEDIFKEEVSKLDKRYTLTKNVGYGYIYGAGLDKMAVTAGVLQEQMAPIRQAFLDRYPGLEIMSREIIAEGRRNAADNGGIPCVYTPTGRRLTTDPDKAYVLVNRKIQGHAAEVLKLSGIQLEAADIMQYVKLPIHDEFLLSVPIELAEEVKVKSEEVMSFNTQYKLPVTASADILGERWIKK